MTVGCDILKFILASASERRKELLSRIVRDFEVRVSDFDEDSVQVNNDIEKYVKTLSQGKAKSVALNCSKDSIIIGADTIVVIDNKVLGKPKDKNDAFRIKYDLKHEQIKNILLKLTAMDFCYSMLDDHNLTEVLYVFGLTENLWNTEEDCQQQVLIYIKTCLQGVRIVYSCNFVSWSGIQVGLLL